MNDLSSMILKAFGEGLLKAIPTIWPMFALIALVVVAKFIYQWHESRRLAASGILDIDKMDGRTFEKYLEVLFTKLGYIVMRTRYVGDYGADLITEKNGIKTIIQAKRYKGKVGVKAVQEAVAAKGYYDCAESMVVTNSEYTKQAIELARANGVILWNRKDLVKALLAAKSSTGRQEDDAVAKTAAGTEGIETVNTPDCCAVCGQTVSPRVKQYCLDHKERFGGKIYCFQHQKGV